MVLAYSETQTSAQKVGPLVVPTPQIDGHCLGRIEGVMSDTVNWEILLCGRVMIADAFEHRREIVSWMNRAGQRKGIDIVHRGFPDESGGCFVRGPQCVATILSKVV